MTKKEEDNEESIFGLPQAPVFYPTREEFQNPWTYLNSIRHIFQRTGICVIQPPSDAGWDFDSFDRLIDPKLFTIDTKSQNVHQMQTREGPTVQFARQLLRFWGTHGFALDKMPEVHGVVVDFLRLKQEIQQRGLEKVESEHQWSILTSLLHIRSPRDPPDVVTADANLLRDHYYRYLHHFISGTTPKSEEDLQAPPAPPPPQMLTMPCTLCNKRLTFKVGPKLVRCPACNGVFRVPQDAIPDKKETSAPSTPASKGPSAPSSATTTPTGKSGSAAASSASGTATAKSTPTTPTQSASDTATSKSAPLIIRCVGPSCRVRLQYQAGIKGIRCPRCSTVIRFNQADGTPLVKQEADAKSDSAQTDVKIKTGETSPMKEDSETQGKKRLLEVKSESGRPAKKSRREEPLWTQVKSRSFTKDDYNRRVESRAMCSDSEDDMPGEETKSTAGDDQNNKHRVAKYGRGTIGGPRQGKRMGGMAARPALQLGPDATQEMLLEAQTLDFGYQTGYTYNLEAYMDMADAFEARWSTSCKTVHEKEREYWRIVENGEVQYGSDLDVGKHGSGFPLNPESKEKSHRARARAWFNARRKKRRFVSTDYMRTIGWNINNLAEQTFLHHVDESVAGVTRGMIYVGMLFSSFCWHTEDNYLYSINYIHTGAAKRWYGIPSSGAALFEKTMREHMPDLFEKTPNLLHLLVTQFSPRILTSFGVPVFTATQKKGQFVVTAPQAYHAGFNTGFNVAESVNFALQDWLPYCRRAVEQYRFKRSAVVPYEEIVLRAALSPDSVDVARIVYPELINVIAKEQSALKRIRGLGITKFINIDESECHPCAECGYDCFLSGIVCTKHGEQIVCLDHAHELCECPLEEKRLAVRVGTQELSDALTGLGKYLEAGLAVTPTTNA